ncbi:TonB-dependent receptor plug domain-containing protein [Mucilaginibacter sp.]|uniref:TonB-dependent receptor plug domain-containing protein n=1 Tax=Mucilaginibacter sp. TaxID=1882438 RepID=UPI00261DB576|nr:TonB-dependent receptor plug domain-containing protein [Mucilaginibacter sp.]MDB4926360.1 TonB-dependent receptor [Mucilaginibacter sp.]
MKRFLLILLMFTCICVKAQETPSTNPAPTRLQTIAASLDSFRRKVSVEKVHIHFDKPFYSLGDTIWMKAYVVIQSNELSALSQILYADLIDDKDSIKTSLRIPLTNGFGWSSITLSDTLLKAGAYRLRAYTNLMRNLGEEYFFDKEIMIGNALPPKSNTPGGPAQNTAAVTNTQVTASPKTITGDVSVQFFPESGTLVNDITSKVGFKAVGSDGLGREISGIIVDKDNNPVTSFQSEHAGMGSFILQPAANNTYTAVIKLADGNEKKVALPAVVVQGYVLSVVQANDNVIVNIQASNSLLNGELSLVAQANNIVQYVGKKTLTSNSFTARIPKNRFPEGITQFTLFSPDYQPIAERLIFIHNNDNHLKLNITADKAAYKKRDNVHLDMEITDQDEKPVVGTFSMAVTDEAKVPYKELNETTIFSNLLLTSDIKGYVEQPNYYFTDDVDNKSGELDNLMLTQGWRKFIWKDVLSHNLPTLTYQAEDGLGLNGRVLTNSKKKPLPIAGARVTLLVNIGDGIIVDTVTNAQGRFNFNKFPFRKGTTYSITATDAKGKKYDNIEIDEQTPQPVTIKHLPQDPSANNDFAAYLDESKQRFDELDKNGMLNHIMLKEIVVKEKITKETIKQVATMHSENLAGPGNADQVLTFIDLLPCQSDLSTCLAGRITGGYSDNGRIFIRGFDLPMYVIVDGISGRGLESVVSSDVSSVEILRGGGAAALYGMHGSNGVLVITTKKGDVDYTAYETERRTPGYNKPQGLKAYTFKVGYDLRKQFYHPDYANPKTNTQLPDLRTTVFWKPGITTGETGKTSVNFFNADGTGNYRVVVEGLDLYGRLGRQVFHYTVK